MTDARSLAVVALQRIEHGGAYANLVLPTLLAESGLEDRERRFATDLVYGTTRMRRACDYAVDRFILREPAAEVRTILRLGAYQLLFGRVPPHAAVSATVSLAPRRTAGFVNAILRKVAAEPVVWPDLATRLSYPDWIVERLTRELGEANAVAALERMNQPAPVTGRADGYVQDQASQWVAELVEAQPGERVADLCAAPGGKATALAARGAFVAAGDVRPGRARLLATNGERLGCSLGTFVGDATAPPYAPASFDRVLIDAPCSGLGALRRRPDARWRVEEASIDTLSHLQRSILAAAQPLVRPGGVLVYSVCTLTAAESVDLDKGAWPALPPPGAPWRPYGRGARLLPQDADTDGMVILRYRRPA